MEGENRSEELKAFLGYFYDNYFNREKTVAPENHPLSVMKGMSPARALRGLEMAINDCVEATSMWSADEVKTCDAALRAEGIVSLSELRRRYSRQVRRVLKKRQIKTEVEYYMLRGIVEDPNLSQEEAQDLWRLMNEYEERQSVTHSAVDS